MKGQKITNYCKNAVGTIFLLGGAFLTCSTLMSMRAAFADPIAPAMDTTASGPQSPRAGANVRSGRASPRTNLSRSVISRSTTAGGVVNQAASSAATVSRAGAGRSVVSRVSPRSSAVNATQSRNVVSRTATNVVSRQSANSGRALRARVADTSRVSLQGSAIRGSKVSNNSTYTYLNSKLYTGNYSNIIDSTTGLISADAFNNCMESYYTCMDEICTARNAAQRRCACAGRVKAFAEAEAQLETANEELIKVSGELALLIANKGKDVSQAFQLTEAEQVMNCVSWKDLTAQYRMDSPEVEEWCNNHGMYDSACKQPDYCKSNTFGFDIDNIDGSSSDILASLQAWAKAKDETVTILKDDTDDLLSAYEGISSIVGDVTGITGSLVDAQKGNLNDSLAETWGYDLFVYAHNNVCSRVLDSCFNGIYEACGAPDGRKCGNGQNQCPYNYNSQISVKNTGTYELDFITANNNYAASNSATCFGYTTTSGDPYANLRGPVADARRSIMQKYALDANADCDAYGEQLRQTAQNIGYQKVAAQQALQQKRLEFATEEEESRLSAARTAMSNFNTCLSEIYECYTETAQSEKDWTTSRIKAHCAQVTSIPHCYEEMICTPSGAQFSAIIDEEDNASCKNTQDYTTNTCRNIVKLNEILNGAYDGDMSDFSPEWGANGNQDSTKLREHCLRNAMGISLDGKEDADSWNIRNWKKPVSE